jgi:hypothetical protein
MPVLLSCDIAVDQLAFQKLAEPPHETLAIDHRQSHPQRRDLVTL